MTPDSRRSLPPNGTTVLRGRDHPRLGASAVAWDGTSLAVGISAGARAKPSPALDANEDVGAVVKGSRADLLVVADGHFGCEASELAVDHVLAAIGDEPPPATLSDEQLIAIFFDAGVAVQRETSRVGSLHPDSRTTLALALVADDAVQWAAIGDSCVVVAGNDGGARLDVPRSAYLGHRFGLTDIAAALTRGRRARSSVDCLVLATDGFVDCLVPEDLDVAAVVSDELGSARDPEQVVERLLALALDRDADDAVTIAVAWDPLT